MRKHFYNRRSIHNRIKDAPETMTAPECAFYLGCHINTVRGWLKEWREPPLNRAKIAVFAYNRWEINKTALVNWLAAMGMLPEGGKYDFPLPSDGISWLRARRAAS